MPEQTGATPEGYTTVAPWIVTEDTAASLRFVTGAFGGEEIGRVLTEDGLVGHAEIRVGDTVVPTFDRREDRPAMPGLLRVFVPDADEACARAVALGGRVVTPVMDNPFGRRGCRVRDPFGDIWWVTAHVEDVTEEQVWECLEDPVHVAGMREAQKTLDAELSGRSRGRSSAPVKTA